MEGRIGMVGARVSEGKHIFTYRYYIGTFTDLERFKWDMVAYKRSGGNLDGVEVLVRGDHHG